MNEIDKGWGSRLQKSASISYLHLQMELGQELSCLLLIWISMNFEKFIPYWRISEKNQPKPSKNNLI